MNSEHFKRAREAAGLGQIEVAVALERESGSMISMVERGVRSLSLDHAVMAARLLGVSVDYLVGLCDDPRPASTLVAELDRLDAVRHVSGDEDDLDHGLSERAMYVEIHEVEAAAGAGRLIDGAPVLGRLAFQREWLVAHHINPDFCTVISVSGDSMEPTLPDGCSTLVDHSRLVLRNGHIYVLENDDELLVKRAVGSTRKGWKMVSDNRYWPPVPWPKDAMIKGEVKWSARTL